MHLLIQLGTQAFKPLKWTGDSI